MLATMFTWPASARRRSARACIPETQVVAVATQQQRDARTNCSRVKGRSQASATAEGPARVDPRAGEGVDRRGERAWLPRTRGSAVSSPRPRERATRLLRPQGLIWPVSGPVTSPFGYRWGRLHAGIDIGVRYGTPIHARCVRHRGAGRLDRRLRQLHVHRPRRRDGDVLRTPIRRTRCPPALRCRRAR